MPNKKQIQASDPRNPPPLHTPPRAQPRIDPSKTAEINHPADPAGCHTPLRHRQRPLPFQRTIDAPGMARIGNDQNLCAKLGQLRMNLLKFISTDIASAGKIAVRCNPRTVERFGVRLAGQPFQSAAMPGIGNDHRNRLVGLFRRRLDLLNQFTQHPANSLRVACPSVTIAYRTTPSRTNASFIPLASATHP